jgi:hypothetical protein
MAHQSRVGDGGGWRRLLVALLLVTFTHTGAFAQGVQTGTLRGLVRDQQSLPVPGVTVTVTSPNLQGSRSAVTDEAGAYVLPQLPAGDYQVMYQLSGFAGVTERARIALGLPVDLNVTMRAGNIAEEVRVVAETPAPIATPTVGLNVKQDEVEALATSRTIIGISQLSPAVSDHSPQGGGAQVVINGAFAFDNVFMVNGVDINDNLFAQPQNLFIEDAIQETQVLTSGISAEYGRFSGGVINAITKSGGNTFSGSWRVNFRNPSWTDETPFQKSRKTENPDINQRTHEATFGGPIVRDRLWFFTAGRYQATDTPLTLQESGVDVLQNDTNKRGELKLTGRLADSHTLQGSFLNNPRTVTNGSGVQSLVVDPNSESTPNYPNWYYYTTYRGVARKTLIEAQYSQRKFSRSGDGGSSTALVDSPFVSLECPCIYNAPYFDANDPSQRNNRQFTANATTFWSRGGRHDTKAGYEMYRSQTVGGNSQSPSSYVYNADFQRDAAGAPALDAQGRFIPVFVPGETYLEFYPATVGATMNIDTHSAFVQDHWAMGARWSADLGLRFEKAQATSTGDITSVSTNPRVVPRLGIGYDVSADGSRVIHATYGQYSGRYQENQVGPNSPVGNPAYLRTFYQGPAGSGRSFAPGFVVGNYPITPANVGAIEVPLANIFVDDNLKTALTHEATLSYGTTFGARRGYAEATWVFRRMTNMIEDTINRDNGTTHVVFSGVDAGDASNLVYRNTDIAKRRYQALEFQSRYQLSSRWNVNGHYTLQLQNHGNYEGEGTNTPGSVSIIEDYPEAFTAERNYPDGRLQGFQRHRMRVWSIYDWGMGRFGRASVSGMWRVESGGAYSLAALNVPLSAKQLSLIEAAGYPDNPGVQTLYFGDRGNETFAGFGLFDTSVNYDVPVFRSLRPWIKVDIFNLLNNDKLIAWNTTVRPDPNSPLDAMGLPTGYIKGSSFGAATGNTQSNVNVQGIPSYPQWSGGQQGGRTLRVSTGIRF